MRVECILAFIFGISIGMLLGWFIPIIIKQFKNKDINKDKCETQNSLIETQDDSVKDINSLSNSEYCSAESLAEYIIYKCIKDGQYITNLELNQILYMLQVENITLTGKPIFFDIIQAKRFGAIISTVYYKYCGFGAEPIRQVAKEPNIEFKGFLKNNIDYLICYYRRLEPWDWSNKYFKVGCGNAWDRAYCNGYGNENVIDIDNIKVYK